MFSLRTMPQSGTVAEALLQKPFSAEAPLRIMIADGHSAPLNEAGFYLRTTLSNISIEPFAFYAYAQFAAVKSDQLLPMEARKELDAMLHKCSLPQRWESCITQSMILIAYRSLVPLRSQPSRATSTSSFASSLAGIARFSTRFV